MVTERQLLIDETRAEHGRVTTVLANERTFLAFVRTALGFFGAAAAVARWAEFPGHNVMLIVLAAVGIVILVLGARRFILVRTLLTQTRSES